MLFILRKIRRSFFLPGKIRTYLAYAAGEIVLIVVGILLALQISEWNQARKDRMEEKEMLIALKAEFEINRRRMERAIVVRSAIADAANRLLQLSADGEAVTPEELDRLISHLNWYLKTDLADDVLNRAIQEGKLELIEDSTLGAKVAAFTSRHANFRIGQEQQYRTFNQFLTPFLVKELNYIQISNAQLTEPGVGGSKQPILPLGTKSDHSHLLQNREFLGLVAISLQEHREVKATAARIINRIDELLKDIDQALVD